MKKKDISVSNPDELNKHLQHTSPITWLVLGLVTAMIISFFVWSFIYKIPIKLLGQASISSGEVTLVVKDKDLNKLEVGQPVYILDKQGEILSFNDDKQPVISHFDLADGDYEYKIVLKETRPIDFLIGK